MNDQELMAQYLSFASVECGLSPNTLLAYENDLGIYLQFCRDMGIPPVAASVDLLATYLRSLTRVGYATSSVIRFMLSVQSFYSFLQDRRIVAANPVRALDLPKAEEKLPDVLSREAMERLIAAVDPNSRLGLRDIAMLELFYASGIRVSELVGLRIEDWHPSMAMMKVSGKGSKDRVVPVHNTASDAIDRYLVQKRPILAAVKCERRKETDVLFLSRSGLPLTRLALWQLLQHVSAKAGLRPVHPHTLRHSFASHMLSGGADLRVIQEILGHENVTTTQRYTQVDIDHLKRIHKLHPRQ